MLKKHIELKAGHGNVNSVSEPAVAAKPKKPSKLSSRKKKSAPQSKSDRVLTLLRQSGGASLDELMKATNWQAHSVRGFLSGAVKKRKGLMIMSASDGEGTRRYRIEAGQGV
jgi:hypothetical protein